MTDPTSPPPDGAPTTPPEGAPGWTAPPSSTSSGSPGSPPPPWATGWERRRREGRTGPIIGGLVLVSLGLLFLANEFVPGLDIGRLWPIILVVIGAAVLVGAFRRD